MAHEIGHIGGTNRGKFENLARESLGEKLIDDGQVVMRRRGRQATFLQQVVLESIDDALPWTLYGRFPVRLDDPRLAKQGEEPIQCAAITASVSNLSFAFLQKAIQHLAVKAGRRNAFLLKPLTEIGDR